MQLYGTDSHGHRFQRLSSTALASSIPLKPIVTVESTSIEIKSNRSKRVQCHVQSQLPYQVQWFKNERLLSTNEYPYVSWFVEG